MDQEYIEKFLKDLGDLLRDDKTLGVNIYQKRDISKWLRYNPIKGLRTAIIPDSTIEMTLFIERDNSEAFRNSTGEGGSQDV